MLGFYWQTFLTLHGRWVKFDEAYSHGYIVILMTLYFVWMRRDAVMSAAIKPSRSGLIVTLSGSVLWSIGYLSISGVLEQVAIPVIFWGVIWAALGWGLARELIGPVLFFYFAIPIWDVLVTPLQILTTEVTSWVMLALSIPVYVDGFFFKLPSGIVEVSGGCSGLNYLMIGLIVGFSYSELVLNSRCRIYSILLAAGFALLANWVRVISLVLIAFYTEMGHPLITESHVNFGWYVFAAALTAFFFTMHLTVPFLLHKQKKIEHGGDDESARGGLVLPEKKENARKAKAVIVGLALLLGFGFPQLVVRLNDSMQSSSFEAYLIESHGYLKSTSFTWLPKYSGYDWAGQWVRELDGREITATVLTYSEQWQGKELVFYGNKLAPEYMVNNYGTVHLGSNESLASAVISTRDATEDLIVFWVYRVGGEYTTSRVEAKLLLLRGYAQGDPSSSLIVFTSPCGYNCVATDDFSDMGPAVYDFLSAFNIKFKGGGLIGTN